MCFGPSFHQVLERGIRKTSISVLSHPPAVSGEVSALRGGPDLQKLLLK